MEPDPAGGDGGDRLPAEHQRPLVDGGRQADRGAAAHLRRRARRHRAPRASHLRVRRAAAVRGRAARGRAARHGRGGGRRRARLPRGRRAVGGARLGQRPVGRGAAARGRRARGALAAAPHPRGRPREPARGVRAGRDEHRHLGGGRPVALLPARPVVADRVLDRRQRGRELRRRALLQVRLHDELRLRPGGRAPRRVGRGARRQGARPARLRPAAGSSSARRARSAWRRRSPCASCPRPSRCARSCPSSSRPSTPGTRCRPSSRRAWCPGRSR